MALLLFPAATAHGNEPVIIEAYLELQLDPRGAISGAYNLSLAASHDEGQTLRLPPAASDVSIIDGAGRSIPFTREPDGAARLLASGTPAERTLWVTYRLDGPLPLEGRSIPLPHLSGAFVELLAYGDQWRLAPLLREPDGVVAPDEARSGHDWAVWRWDADVLEEATLTVKAAPTQLGASLGALAPAFLLVALLSWLAVSWTERRVPDGSERMPVMGHLEEVRWRIVALLASLAAGLVVFFGTGPRAVTIAGTAVSVPWPAVTDNYAAAVLDALAAWAVPPGVRLIVTTPFEAVLAELAACLLLALAVTVPVALLETYRFLRPGLYERERRTFRRAIPLMVALFAAGVAFGLVVLVPLLVGILYAFAAPIGAETLLSLGSFLSFVAMTLIAMGLAFQLPPLMAGAVAFRLATPRLYLKYWRHAIVAIFLAAGLMTDPTLVSQVVVGGVLAALYFAGIGLSMLVAERRKKGQRVAET